MLKNIENLLNDLREYNYNNQCNSYVPCKYWRADCCIFNDRCRFKHFKINKFPLDCPYGISCKRKIDGKCNCVCNIRKKSKYRLTKSRIGKPIGNTKNNKNLKSNQDRNQVNLNHKIITSQNNGIKRTATNKFVMIKVPQFKSNNSDSSNINQSENKEEEKQLKVENINNNNNNNNNNELKEEKDITNDKDLPDISGLNLSLKDNVGKYW